MYVTFTNGHYFLQHIIMKIMCRTFFILVLSINIAFMSSCRVSLLPSYDAQLTQQIETVSRKVDSFYLSMLETTVTRDSGRAYVNFAMQYVDIEVELNSLLNRNKIRPLNANSTRICQITLDLWVKYKEEHKADNTLTDGLIKLNRKTFDDLFFGMQVAEKGKEKVGSL